MHTRVLGRSGCLKRRRLRNTVSASSYKLCAFNTLSKAMEDFWQGEPLTEAEDQPISAATRTSRPVGSRRGVLTCRVGPGMEAADSDEPDT